MKSLNQLVKEENEIFETEVINLVPNLDYEQYSEAQKLNPLEFYNGRGKLVTEVRANLRITSLIAKIKSFNFGSISAFTIDSLPQTLVKCKGTDITYLSDKEHRYKGITNISRRFLSNILSYWSFVLGVPYVDIEKKRSAMDVTGITIWSKRVYTKNPKKLFQVLTGEDAILMIRDLIFLTRDLPAKKMLSKLDNQKISPFLYNLLREKVYTKKLDYDVFFQAIKGRLYRIYSTHNKSWGFPKYSVEYLIRVIDELKTGGYILDLGYPVIYDMWTYPIKCTDTQLKPMSNEEHEENLKDYDLYNYILERNTKNVEYPDDTPNIKIDRCPDQILGIYSKKGEPINWSKETKYWNKRVNEILGN